MTMSYLTQAALSEAAAKRAQSAIDDPQAPLAAGPINQKDAAVYIASMCGELALVAETTGMGFLSYLLDVAREEAVLQADAPQRRRQPCEV